MEGAAWVALASVAILLYIYVGYPLLVALLAWACPRPSRKGGEGEALSFSVVIAAYNEQRHLGEKLQSIASAAEGLALAEVVVGSDGSTDESEQVVADAASSLPIPIRWRPFPLRRGKPSVLNDVLPQCRGEIVVLTDARQPLEPNSLRALLRNFSDPKVGVVSGELIFLNSTGGSAERSMGFYWSYEKFIRRREARMGSVPGATGALYALRRSLFRPIDAETILDDVAIPMRIVEQGYRCVFEPEAVVFDRPSSSHGQENVRKRRTIAGNAQLFAAFPRWVLPWRNPIAFQWVSHKLLRLLSPILLLSLMAASLLMLTSMMGLLLVLGQLALYAMAAAGWVLDRKGRSSKLLAIPRMFVELNAVTLLALGDALRGRYRATWNKAYAGGESISREGR